MLFCFIILEHSGASLTRRAVPVAATPVYSHFAVFECVDPPVVESISFDESLFMPETLELFGHRFRGIGSVEIWVKFTVPETGVEVTKQAVSTHGFFL